MDISGDLLRYGKKDNSPAADRAKIVVRNHVLQAIGEDKAVVLDCYAGEGQMFRGIWHRAMDYVGCDKDLFMDDRPAYVADNRRLLRAIDLGQFNIIDLDAWGSPWEQFYIIATRRPLAAGEQLGVVMTEGTGLKMNMGGVSKALATLARIRVQMPGMGAARDEVIGRALRQIARMMHARIVSRWQAQGKRGSRVGYIGLIFEGLADVDQPEEEAP